MSTSEQYSGRALEQQGTRSGDVLAVGAATHKGRDHVANEDRIWHAHALSDELLKRKGYLSILADGVGGYNAGDVASQLAVETISRRYYEDEASDIPVALEHALTAANAIIYERAQQPGCEDMATTVVAAVVHDGVLTIAHVGDSRAYLLHAGELRVLTQDHTWVAERVAMGVLPHDAIQHHELRHVITRALGSERVVAPDIASFAFDAGDRLLLSCDGLWEPLSEGEIAAVLARESSAEAMAEDLVRQAIEVDGQDDTSVLVVLSDAPSGETKGNGRLVGVSTPLIVLIALTVMLTLVGGALVASSGLARWTANRAPVETFAVSDDPAAQLVAPTAASATGTAPVMQAELGTATRDLVLVASTATPKPVASPAPTVTRQPSVVHGAGYCILHIPEDPEAPASSVNLANCSGTVSGDEPIPNGTEIALVEPFEAQVCDGLPVVSIRYRGKAYWIYNWRIGRVDEDGACSELPSGWWEAFDVQ
jgi:PPM family protein phosphatase